MKEADEKTICVLRAIKSEYDLNPPGTRKLTGIPISRLAPNCRLHRDQLNGVLLKLQQEGLIENFKIGWNPAV